MVKRFTLPAALILSLTASSMASAQTVPPEDVFAGQNINTYLVLDIGNALKSSFFKETQGTQQPDAEVTDILQKIQFRSALGYGKDKSYCYITDTLSPSFNARQFAALLPAAEKELSESPRKQEVYKNIQITSDNQKNIALISQTRVLVCTSSADMHAVIDRILSKTPPKLADTDPKLAEAISRIPEKSIFSAAIVPKEKQHPLIPNIPGFELTSFEYISAGLNEHTDRGLYIDIHAAAESDAAAKTAEQALEQYFADTAKLSGDNFKADQSTVTGSLPLPKETVYLLAGLMTTGIRSKTAAPDAPAAKTASDAPLSKPKKASKPLYKRHKPRRHSEKKPSDIPSEKPTNVPVPLP